MVETSTWRVLPRDRMRSEELARDLNVTSITAQLLINRGITGRDEARSFLFGCLEDIESPWKMSGIREAISYVDDAISAGKKIRIFGDYDADGVTSTVLLLTFLSGLGASVDYYIPHRVEEGYGLSPGGIEKAAGEGVSLIITVDCGVSDLKEVALARSLGLKVIIVDHHEISTDLPDAQVLINPRNPACAYPFKTLAGVGVVFKLVQGICEKRSMPFPREYLDLVALGTIADAVPLIGENRILVREGLKLLSASPSPGVLSLLEMRYRRSYPLNVKDLSCSIIPRINAPGRIERADVAVQLLMCRDLKQAVSLASDLDELNRRRQKIEEQIRQSVLRACEQDCSLRNGSALVMASEDWHAGVLGITAYRISEVIGKPVFLIALKDGVGKGSARTAGEENLFGIMQGVEDLFLHYGGHFAAGGFSIRKEDIPLLRERLDSCSLEPSSGSATSADMEIELKEITMDMVRELKIMEPFGEGNSLPLFMARGIRLREMKTVGDGSHLRVVLRQDGSSIDGIAFRKGNLKESLCHDDLLYDLIFTPEIDSYRGTSRICAKVTAFMYPDSHSHGVISGPSKSRPGFEDHRKPLIIDSRNVCNRLKYIQEILKAADNGVLVVRTSAQMKKLEKIFRNEGLDVCPAAAGQQENGERAKGRLLLAFPGQLPGAISAEDVLFFSSPPSLLHFSHPLYRRIRRIHFLFNAREIEFEERLQRLSQPTPDRIVKIQQLLGELAEEAGRTDRVVEMLDDSLIKKITVEISFRILKELGMLEERREGIFIHKTSPVTEEELAGSPLFKSLIEQRDSFYRFRDLYENSFDELRRAIGEVIGGDKLQ